MLQYERNGVVFTVPKRGKMLRIKGQEDLISKAADYKGKVPEYEEVDPSAEPTQEEEVENEDRADWSVSPIGDS